MPDVQSITVQVDNEQGLHARPAMMLLDVASKYACRITLIKEGQRVDGKSILEMLTLAANRGTRLVIEAEGADAPDALAALEALFNQRFGE